MVFGGKKMAAQTRCLFLQNTNLCMDNILLVTMLYAVSVEI